MFLGTWKRKKEDREKRKREGGIKRGLSILVRGRREKICVWVKFGFKVFICMFSFWAEEKVIGFK